MVRAQREAAVSALSSILGSRTSDQDVSEEEEKYENTSVGGGVEDREPENPSTTITSSSSESSEALARSRPTTRPEHQRGRPSIRRGRPRKDAERAGGLHSDELTLPVDRRRRGAYKPLSEFTRLPATLHDLSFWSECALRARPMKRGRRANKKNVGPYSDRPPVDILQVRGFTGESMYARGAPPPPTLSISRLVRLQAGVDLKNYPLNLTQQEPETRTYVAFSHYGQGVGDDPSGACFLSAGPGGISALEWVPPSRETGERSPFQLLLTASYPSSKYQDHFAQVDSNSCPLLIYHVSMVEQLPRADLTATIEHPLGLVRELHAISWGGTDFLVLGIFGTGQAALFTVPYDIGGTWRLANPLVIGGGMVTTGCILNSPTGLIIVLGYADGLIRWWMGLSEEDAPFSSSTRPLDTDPIQVDADEDAVPVKCVAAMTISKQPITALSPHPRDPWMMAVGMHDSRALLVDLRSSWRSLPLASPIAAVPLVHFTSEADGEGEGGCLIADSEASLRFLPMKTLIGRSSVPAGTFDVPVMAMDSSPFHNVIVSAGSDGTAHMSILVGGEHVLMFERTFLQVRMADTDLIHIDQSLRVPQLRTGPVALPTPDTAIAAIKWSRSSQTPGLLAIGMGSVGLLALLPMDRLLLLEPEE